MRSSDMPQSTCLDGITARAQKEKKRRFDNLYSLLTIPMLRWAYFQLRPHASAGVDRMTWNEYGEALNVRLQDLHGRLIDDNYRAPHVRRIYIPKSNGKMRPLGIPCLEDKIVQRSVAEILNAIFNGDFDRGSFGYRPGISAHDAVLDLTGELQCGMYGYVVEADIQGFFDNLDHDWLIRMIEQRVEDRRLVCLIRKWLKAGILEPNGQLVHSATGTPQGGIVSPILANIYLHFALDLWFEKIIKRHNKGRCFLVRYADDFVAGFQFQHEAKAYEQDLSQRLVKFNLAVEPSKTGMHAFSRHLINRRGSFDFLGFTYRWQYDSKGNPRVTCTTAKSKLRSSLRALKEWAIQARNWKPRYFFARLRQKLTGYRNYYGIRGNSKMLCAMWYHAFKLVHKWLNRRSQRRSYTLTGLTAAMIYYAIPKPTIRHDMKRRPVPYLWRAT